jgi:exopolyphosphatase/guanosine-5'-triphosphate,3'-diphosphate pyrophosphatase
VGVLYDLLGRRERRDLRDATVERLQDRFGVDRAQARRVGSIAQQALAQLNEEADPDLAQQLGWAAALHEVGFAISHNDYHKHGAYLAQHADLAGFSTSDQQRIALLILGQRGNLKKLAGALDAPDVLAKIVSLRLAVLLCHARRDVELPAWSLRSTRGVIELGLDGDWLSHHPLTEHLLQEEAAQWEKAGHRFTLVSL